MSEMSPELQEKIRQLQAAGQQLQMVAQQRAQMEMMHSENGRALEALEASDADAPVYRSLGSLMVREGRDEAIARLKDESDTLKNRVKRVKEQESQLGDQLGELEKEIQKALQ